GKKRFPAKPCADVSSVVTTPNASEQAIGVTSARRRGLRIVVRDDAMTSSPPELTAGTARRARSAANAKARRVGARQPQRSRRTRLPVRCRGEGDRGSEDEVRQTPPRSFRCGAGAWA